MTQDELKNAVSTVLEQPHSTQLYLILKVNDELVLRLADIEDDNTAPEIQHMFVEFLETTIVSNEDMVVRNLSVADESPNAVSENDYDSYPEELNLFKQFNIEEAVNIDHFNFNTDDLNHLFGYIVYIGSMESGIVLFKKHYPISLIKRESFLLGAIKSSERFEKLPGEDIIRLNNDAQLLRVGDAIFVLNLKMLERNMGFSALIQRAAAETVDAIEELDIINIFLRAIYLYDDRFTLILNGSDTPITIDDILLDEIEEGLKGDLTNCEGCSSLVADAPPILHLLIYKGCRIFLAPTAVSRIPCRVVGFLILD